MNPLNEYPAIRRALYLVQWVTTGATGVLGIVFAAQESVPQAYTITVAALAFVWTYTGLTAQGNTPAGYELEDDAEIHPDHLTPE